MLMANERDVIELQALERMQRDVGGQIVGRTLVPIAGSLGALVREESLSCEVAGNWYAVVAESRHEKMAKEAVASEGIPTYLPLIAKQEKHGRGSTRTVERPMFGPYFFARCRLTDENYRKIRFARGVHKMLDVTGDGKPIAIPTAAIQVIRAVEAEAGTRRGRSELVWHFTPGDLVRIKDGPFSGFYAQLESAVDEHERIKALVDIFGRKTPVQFDASQLEAL